MKSMSIADVTYEGQKLGVEARREGGRKAVDAEGGSLLPTGPLQGDLDYLEGLLEREPTRQELRAFADGYRHGLTLGTWTQRDGRWVLVTG